MGQSERMNWLLTKRVERPEAHFAQERECINYNPFHTSLISHIIAFLNVSECNS